LSSSIAEWDKDLARGKWGEGIIEQSILPQGFTSKVVGKGLERKGIDRIVTLDNCDFSAEFKTDFASSKTGNYFIETRIKKGNKTIPGWARKSIAQLLFILNPGKKYVLLLPMAVVKLELARWSNTYKYIDNVENDIGLTGCGLCVPEEEIVQYSRVFPAIIE